MLQLFSSCLHGVAIHSALFGFRRPTALIILALLGCAAGARAGFGAENEPVSAEEKARGFRTRTLLAKPRAGLSAIERAEAIEQVRLVRSHPRLGGLRT